MGAGALSSLYIVEDTSAKICGDIVTSCVESVPVNVNTTSLQSGYLNLDTSSLNIINDIDELLTMM